MLKQSVEGPTIDMHPFNIQPLERELDPFD